MAPFPLAHLVPAIPLLFFASWFGDKVLALVFCVGWLWWVIGDFVPAMGLSLLGVGCLITLSSLPAAAVSFFSWAILLSCKCTHLCGYVVIGISIWVGIAKAFEAFEEALWTFWSRITNWIQALPSPHSVTSRFTHIICISCSFGLLVWAGMSLMILLLILVGNWLYHSLVHVHAWAVVHGILKPATRVLCPSSQPFGPQLASDPEPHQSSTRHHDAEVAHLRDVRRLQVESMENTISMWRASPPLNRAQRIAEMDRQMKHELASKARQESYITIRRNKYTSVCVSCEAPATHTTQTDPRPVLGSQARRDLQLDTADPGPKSPSAVLNQGFMLSRAAPNPNITLYHNVNPFEQYQQPQTQQYQEPEIHRHQQPEIHRGDLPQHQQYQHPQVQYHQQSQIQQHYQYQQYQLSKPQQYEPSQMQPYQQSGAQKYQQPQIHRYEQPQLYQHQQFEIPICEQPQHQHYQKHQTQQHQPHIQQHIGAGLATDLNRNTIWVIPRLPAPGAYSRFQEQTNLRSAAVFPAFLYSMELPTLMPQSTPSPMAATESKPAPEYIRSLPLVVPTMPSRPPTPTTLPTHPHPITPTSTAQTPTRSVWNITGPNPHISTTAMLTAPKSNHATPIPDTPVPDIPIPETPTPAVRSTTPPTVAITTPVAPTTTDALVFTLRPIITSTSDGDFGPFTHTDGSNIQTNPIGGNLAFASTIGNSSTPTATYGGKRLSARLKKQKWKAQALLSNMNSKQQLQQPPRDVPKTSASQNVMEEVSNKATELPKFAQASEENEEAPMWAAAVTDVEKHAEELKHMTQLLDETMPMRDYENDDRTPRSSVLAKLQLTKENLASASGSEPGPGTAGAKTPLENSRTSFSDQLAKRFPDPIDDSEAYEAKRLSEGYNCIPKQFWVKK